MRVVAVIVLAVWSQTTLARDSDPISNIVSCTKELGPVKCITAYGAWRAERAVQIVKENVTDESRFPWERFRNEEEEELYTKLCEQTEEFLRHRSLTLDLGDYAALLGSKNGSLQLDLVRNSNEEVTGRGSMKKMSKYFYQLLPVLLVPGLIMSAVLPFVLPAFKMMVLGTGMLNNMALMGSIFTLLRNNAFNDNHSPKVIYINEGYKNERLRPLAAEVSEQIIHPNFNSNFNGDVTHDIQDYHIIEDDGYSGLGLDNYGVNPDWIKKFNDARGKYANILNGKIKRKEGKEEEHRVKF